MLARLGLVERDGRILAGAAWNPSLATKSRTEENEEHEEDQPRHGDHGGHGETCLDLLNIPRTNVGVRFCPPAGNHESIQHNNYLFFGSVCSVISVTRLQFFVPFVFFSSFLWLRGLLKIMAGKPRTPGPLPQSGPLRCSITVRRIACAPGNRRTTSEDFIGMNRFRLDNACRSSGSAVAGSMTASGQRLRRSRRPTRSTQRARWKYQAPDFRRIKNSDYAPAMEAGMCASRSPR